MAKAEEEGWKEEVRNQRAEGLRGARRPTCGTFHTFVHMHTHAVYMSQTNTQVHKAHTWYAHEHVHMYMQVHTSTCTQHTQVHARAHTCTHARIHISNAHGTSP